MKKIVTCLALIASICSCSRESKPLDANVYNAAFSASIEQNTTKGTYNNLGVYSWSNDDQVGVLVDGNYNSPWLDPFTYSSTKSKFEATLDGEKDEFFSVVATYPWTGWKGEGGTNYYDGYVYFRLRSSIAYSETAVPLPLMAYLGTGRNPSTAEFRQLAGGIKVPINRIPPQVNKVRLTVTGKDISGESAGILPADADPSAITPAVITISKDNCSYVEYTFDKSSSSRNMVFTFPVAPFDNAPFTIDVYEDETIIGTKQGKSTSITRGDILPMPAIDAEEYYLIGYINGEDSGNGGDWETLNSSLKFSNGSLTTTFTQMSYVGVKNAKMTKWYWSASYVENPEGKSAVFQTGNKEKLGLNAGTYTFTLTQNSDGSLTLNYTVD